jgi:1,4-alpha-glucan branching enzyme
LRELLALQSSDWAFLTTRELAGEYPRERVAAHLTALEQTLNGDAAIEQSVRSLAPDLFGWEG